DPPPLRSSPARSGRSFHASGAVVDERDVARPRHQLVVALGVVVDLIGEEDPAADPSLLDVAYRCDPVDQAEPPVAGSEGLEVLLFPADHRDGAEPVLAQDGPGLVLRRDRLADFLAGGPVPEEPRD